MNFKKSFFVWSILVLFLMLLLPAKAYGGWFKTKPRTVDITWNDTLQDGQLIILTGDDPRTRKSRDIASFKLKKKDSVTINLFAAPDVYNKINIKYEVKDPKTNKAFADDLGQFLGLIEAKQESEPLKASVQVLEKLKPGGSLAITFTMIATDKKGKEVKKTVRELEIDIEGTPKYFTSTGFVFSNANYRELAIIKTANKVSYEKDGKTMEGYEQKLVFKNDSGKLKVKESAVQLVHYKVGGPIYFTLGTPLNEKIFTEAFFGFSGLLNFKGGGLVINIGGHYLKETKIMDGTGFSKDQIFSPSNEITLDDIQTDSEPVLRFFIGISFRL